MKYIIKLIILIVLINPFSYADPIKAKIVERISQFVQWPLNTNEEFIIYTYKNEAIKDLIQRDYEEEVQNPKVKVYNVNKLDNLEHKRFDLFYFSGEINSEIESFLRKIEYRPILVVTDSPDEIYNQNIHIAIYFSEKKIKFIVNKTAMENSNLKASYQLLKLAKIVER